MGITQPTKLFQVSGFVYTAGQNGTPVFAGDFVDVQKAAVISVEGQAAGSEAISAQVNGVNLGSGTIGTISPVANEIVLFLYNTVTSTITEIATATISATINILVEGH